MNPRALDHWMFRDLEPEPEERPIRERDPREPDDLDYEIAEREMEARMTRERNL